MNRDGGPICYLGCKALILLLLVVANPLMVGVGADGPNVDPWGRAGSVDLKVMMEDISFDPAKPFAGEPLIIETQIRNMGPDDATNVTVHLKVDGDQLSMPLNTTKDPIVPATGSPITFTIKWNLTSLSPGTHLVQVILVNSTDQSESDFTDNSASTVLAVMARTANVSIVSILPVLPISHFIGDLVNISVGLVNDGNGDSSGVDVRFYKDGAMDVELTSDPIPGNSTRVINVTYRWNTTGATRGVHVFSVGLVGQDLVQSANITILDMDDMFTIESVTPSTNEGVVGDIIGISIILSNMHPDDPMEVTLVLKLDSNGPEIAALVVVVPSAGVKMSVKYNWSTDGVDPGIHYITVGANGSMVSSTLIELKEAKYVISIIEVDHPLNVEEGAKMFVSIHVANTGNMVARNIVLRLYEDGIQVNSTRVTLGIGVERTYELSFFVSKVIGDSLVALRVEVEGESATSTFFVRDLFTVVPMVEISSFVVVPKKVQRGQDITISLILVNKGSGEALAYIIEFFYDDNPIYQDVRDIPVSILDPISFNWQIPLKATFGKHEISVQVWTAFKEKMIEEAVEEIELPIEIRPILEITNLEISKIPPNAPVGYTISEAFYEGELLYITLTIENLGNLNATNVEVIMRSKGEVLGQKVVNKVPELGKKEIVFEWTAISGKQTLDFEIEGFQAGRSHTVDVSVLLNGLTLDILGLTVFFTVLLAMVFSIQNDIRKRDRPESRFRSLQERISYVKDKDAVSDRTRMLVKRARSILRKAEREEDD